MKTNTVIASVLAAIVLTTAGANAAVNVSFENPEKFSDVSYSDFPNEKDRKYILEDIEEYMVDKLEDKVGDDKIVNVVVKNVDLAGEFEPWRRVMPDNRRIRSVYPARLALDYEITDLDGNLIEKGSEKMTLMDHAVSFSLRNEDHPYVKELINRWVGSLKVKNALKA